MRHYSLTASVFALVLGLTVVGTSTFSARANELDHEKQYSTQQMQLAQALPKTLVVRVKTGTNQMEILHSNVALAKDASTANLVSTSSFIKLDPSGNPVRELDSQSSTSSFGFRGIFGGGGFGRGGFGGGFRGGVSRGGFGGGRGGYSGGQGGYYGRGGYGGRGGYYGRGGYGGRGGYYGNGGFYPTYNYGGYVYPYAPYYGYANGGYYYLYYGNPYPGNNPYCTPQIPQEPQYPQYPQVPPQAPEPPDQNNSPIAD